MMAALLRTIHLKTINTDIQIKNRMSYLMLGDAGSNELDPAGFNPSVDQDTNTALIGHHHPGRP